MEGVDTIKSCLTALTSEDTITYIENCQSLITRSNTLPFREILPQKLEDIVPILILKSAMSNRVFLFFTSERKTKRTNLFPWRKIPLRKILNYHLKIPDITVLLCFIFYVRHFIELF